MKAICGIIQLDGQPANPGEVAAMRAALVGRGVAEEQAWHAGQAALTGVTWWPVDDGISDPTLYTHLESGCTVVADALLFERAELLAALDFPSSRLQDISEAELILHAYLRWGEDCAARLYGDFAFVIHDPRNARVYAARDGMGVRPMYFHHVPGKLFAFASNATAVVAAAQVPDDLNDARIVDFLTNGEGRDIVATFYTAVLRLPPARWCIADAHGCREQCYWTPGDDVLSALPSGDAEWAEAISDALQRAVRLHLNSARSIGSMLSGGLDSSTVAAMAARMLQTDGKPPLPTFSAVNNGNPDCAETRAVGFMLAQPGFAPQLTDLANLDLLRDDLLRCRETSEEPFDNNMSLLHAQYIHAARSGVGAVLDGIDADILFVEGPLIEGLLRSGHWLAAYHEADARAPFFGHPVTPAWKQLIQLAPAAFTPEWFKRSVWGFRQRRAARKDVAASLLTPDTAVLAMRHDGRPISAWPDRGRDDGSLPVARHSIRSAFLTVGIERYRRTASMHGIEPRHPFLDRRLIALCQYLPMRQRCHDGWWKAGLREAARSWLPEAVCWRRGKEHLGGTLTMRLLWHDRNSLLDDLWSDREMLGRYIEPAKLARAIENCRDQDDGGGVNWIADMAALTFWLRKQRPGV